MFDVLDEQPDRVLVLYRGVAEVEPVHRAARPTKTVALLMPIAVTSTSTFWRAAKPGATWIFRRLSRRVKTGVIRASTFSTSWVSFAVIRLICGSRIARISALICSCGPARACPMAVFTEAAMRSMFPVNASLQRILDRSGDLLLDRLQQQLDEAVERSRDVCRDRREHAVDLRSDGRGKVRS